MDETKTPGTGLSRGLRWLLVISLALNLMIAGVIGGWLLQGDKHGRDHSSRLEQIGGPLTRALDHKDRRAIGQEMRKAYRQKPDNRAARQALMETLIAQLRADPFDRDAVAGHMATQREFLNDRLLLGQSLLIDRLGMMTPADRAAYADRLQADLDRHRNK